MDILLILAGLILALYLIGVLAFAVYLLVLVTFDKKWLKAFYILLSYNLWVVAILNKPELEIDLSEALLSKQVNAIKTFFYSVWDFYMDTDVRNSLYRYYHSEDFIPKESYGKIVKEKMNSAPER